MSDHVAQHNGIADKHIPLREKQPARGEAQDQLLILALIVGELVALNPNHRVESQTVFLFGNLHQPGAEFKQVQGVYLKLVLPVNG